MATPKPITARARRMAAQAIARADMRARATLRSVTVQERADDIVRAARRALAARRSGTSG
jgi:hypothetical protein